MARDPEEVAQWRAPAGTVAFVAQRPDCDVCGAPARYETFVRSRGDRVVASTCLPCQGRHGDPVLGAGHSVIFMLPQEVSRPLRRLVRAASSPGQDAMWAPLEASDDEWFGFRLWGFVGPDAAGELHAMIAGIEFTLRVGEHGYVEILQQLGRVFGHSGEETDYAPRGLDELDVRQVLLGILESQLSGREHSRASRMFEISAAQRDSLAVRPLGTGGYDRYIRLQEHGICDSADRDAGLSAAKGSLDPILVGRLALEHPDDDVRAMAIRNPGCPENALAVAAARDGHPLVRMALLEREDLPTHALNELVRELLLDARVDPWFAEKALTKRDFPEDYLARLVGRIQQQGPDARIRLAQAIHKGPPERRDWIHARLLLPSRRIPSTRLLLEAVLAEEVAGGPRLEWLRNHESYKIRSLVAHFLGETSPQPDVSPSSTPARAHHPTPG